MQTKMVVIMAGLAVFFRNNVVQVAVQSHSYLLAAVILHSMHCKYL